MKQRFQPVPPEAVPKDVRVILERNPVHQLQPGARRRGLPAKNRAYTYNTDAHIGFEYVMLGVVSMRGLSKKKQLEKKARYYVAPMMQADLELVRKREERNRNLAYELSLDYERRHARD